MTGSDEAHRASVGVSRRRWLGVSGALLSAPWIPAAAQGAGTGRIVVPFTPGASNDTLGRLIADALSRRGDRTWIVENRPGAGSQLGTEFVAKSAPDGRTLLLAASAGMGILPAVKPALRYAVERDFSFIARVAGSPFALVVNGQLPAADFDAFVKLAREKPGSLRMGSSGIGALDHVGASMLQTHAGISLNIIPYKGMAQVLNDLRAGHIDASIVSPATAAPLIGENRLRALVVLDSRRTPRLPGVPSAEEVHQPDLLVANWWGIVGPAGLPEPVRRSLGSQLDGLLEDPAFRKEMEDKGFDMAPLSGPEFARFVAADLQRWREVARRSRITLSD